MRALAARSSRTRRSYKDAALGTLAVYLRSVDRKFVDRGEKEKEIAWARLVVSTIYSPADPQLPPKGEWQLPVL
jgi:hypothetical protein